MGGLARDKVSRRVVALARQHEMLEAPDECQA
jgi:hypothetical protein